MELVDAHLQFKTTLTSLYFLDQRTQEHAPPLALIQQHIVNEAIFLRAFRAYENFLEEAFIHYTFGKPSLNGKVVISFLHPKDINHAYELIKSSQTFLEWNSPPTVISRAETYLENGGPIKTVLAAKQSFLVDLRKLRNHIAHNSKTSLAEYKKVLNTYYLTIPLDIPEPGALLQQSINIKKNKKKRMVRYILEELADIGDLIAN